MDEAIIYLEIRRCRKHYLLLRKTFATDVERIESVGEVRAFFHVALVRLARLFEAYLLLVKAFLRLFRVHDEFDGLDFGAGHKEACYFAVCCKVTRFYGGGKRQTIS